MDERFGYDRYLLRQRIRPMVNLYEITAHSQAVAFARQKRMALREDIRFFADDSEQDELFRIKARSMMDIGGRYDVVAADGTPVGALVKQFRASLLRSTWQVVDASDQELFVATERSNAVALFRRLADFVPYADMFPIPYHFTCLEGDRELGGLTRVLGVRDQYELELGGDPDGRVDRRLAIALSVALDALQAR